MIRVIGHFKNHSAVTGCDRAPSNVLPRLRQALGSRRCLRMPLTWSPRLAATVERAIRLEHPIPILLLWGKGPKHCPDEAERRAAELLARYANAVSAIWSPGIRYHILFADTHAIVNGHAASETHGYFDETRSVLKAVRADFGLLSDVWDVAGLTWHHVWQEALALDAADWHWANALLQLTAAATRHSRMNPERSARLYFVMRMLENQVLARMFSGFAFATSDGPERRVLSPDLPVLHMYSTARGRCAKPWFMVVSKSEDLSSAGVCEPCAA